MLDKQELLAVKAFGLRLRKARSLCGPSEHVPMTQIAAAKLLGVSTEFLNRLESGLANEGCPVWLVKRAAEAFFVSTDFLLGISSDWETDPVVSEERHFGFFIMEQHSRDLAHLAVQLDRQLRKIDAVADVIKKLEPSIAEINESMERFQELNARFTEMPCGSQLLHRTRVLVRLANEARQLLIRAKIVPFKSSVNYGD